MGKIASKEVGLYVNMGDDTTPDWKLIGCSTSDGFNVNTDNVEIATKCNGGWKENLPDTSSWEFSNAGYAESEPADGETSIVTAESLAHSKEVKPFKIANTDETYYRKGLGYISSYSETADIGDYLQFELTVTGTGDYETTPPV